MAPDRLAHLEKTIADYQGQIAGIERALVLAAPEEKVRLKQKIEVLRAEVEPLERERLRARFGTDSPRDMSRDGREDKRESGQSRVNQAKIATRHHQLAALAADCQVVVQELTLALDPVKKGRLERRLKSLEAEMDQVAAELEELQTGTARATGDNPTDFRVVQGTGANPFNYGSPVEPAGFYGREREIAAIRNRIGAKVAQSINLVGLRRMGKTSLLRYIQGRQGAFFQRSQRPLVVLLDLQDRRFQSPEGITEGLQQGLRRAMGQEPWSKEENQDPYGVEDGLERIRERGYRLVVLLDEFEAIGQHLQQFQDWGDDWRSKANNGLLTLVVASKYPVSEIYTQLDLTSPFGNIFSTTIVGALERKAWQGLVVDGFGVMGVSGAVLGWIDRLAGGVPFYVQMAASLLWQYGWQPGNLGEAEREFRFQARPRLLELWRGLNGMEQGLIGDLALGHGPLEGQRVLLDRLQRNGLVRPTGESFSEVFAEIVVEQRGRG